MPFDPAILRTGDALLYRPSDFFGWLIWLKSWTRIAHIEIYAGEGMSWASRDGIGINRYPLRTAQLGCVRRANVTLDIAKMEEYSASVRGQGYDWRGLATFAVLVKKGSEGKQFCSEFATNDFRAGGFEPFNPSIAADTIAPSEFYQTGAMTTVWTDGK